MTKIISNNQKKKIFDDILHKKDFFCLKTSLNMLNLISPICIVKVINIVFLNSSFKLFFKKKKNCIHQGIFMFFWVFKKIISGVILSFGFFFFLNTHSQLTCPTLFVFLFLIFRLLRILLAFLQKLAFGGIFTISTHSSEDLSKGVTPSSHFHPLHTPLGDSP